MWIAATVGALCFGLGISLPFALILAPDAFTRSFSDGDDAPEIPQIVAPAPQRPVLQTADTTPSQMPQRSASQPDQELTPAPFAVSSVPPGIDALSRRPNTPSDQGIDATIHVHVPNGTPQTRFAAMATTLQAAGFSDVRNARTPYSIRETQVRYFHREDADIAGVIARETGATVRDFTDYRPSPARGSFEMWLAGRATGTRPNANRGNNFDVSREVESFRSAVSEFLNSFPGANER